MQHAAVLALALAASAAWAQEETVPVSVEGTVVEVPSDIAAAACGLDDDQLEAALQGGDAGTATEVETAATTTGTTEDTTTGTTEDVTAAGETGGGAIPVGDDAPEGVDPDLAVGADAEGTATAAGGGTIDVAAAEEAGATPLCEITQAEATAQGIETP
jgi:hypothetical protein